MLQILDLTIDKQRYQGGALMPKNAPEKLYVEGIDYYFWRYELQTQAKHKVLKEYFPSWAKILGAYNSKVCFFDCFGGCGAYIEADGSQHMGSPFIVAEEATKLKKSLNRDVRIFVIEPDKANYENLKKICDSCTELLVKPRFSNSLFEEVIHHNQVKQIYQQYPSFFFVDPFGFSICMEDLLMLMHAQKNELLINFMFDHVSRFIGKPELSGTYDKFFGCGDWRDAISLNGSAREEKLVEIYTKQLKKSAKYVFPFRMQYPDRDRTYYYLFHVTNHIKGCSIMKSAFAAVNYGRVEYLGYRENEMTIFDIQAVKEGDIAEYLKKRYAGKTKTFNEIVEEIIDETFFLEKDIRSSLQGMRKAGLIKVNPVSSKTQRGLGNQDQIAFKPSY